MEQATIQDWTETEVLLKYDHCRRVRYRVYRCGDTVYQEIRDIDGTPVHTLKMPEGVKLVRSSYEVMLRYVLLDVVAA
jgi:hypothetical protein